MNLYAPLEIKFAKDAKAGEFEGYASVFGVIDDGGDAVVPGAFRNTLNALKAAGRQLPMYMQHGAKLGADPRPVGVWTSVEEDEKGLPVKGRMVGLDTETGKYNYALVKEGAMQGLSIGYRVKKADYGKKPGEPRRSLKEVDLGEISIVDSPMLAVARVSAIKSASMIEEFKTLSEIEDHLRDSCGFSRSEAVALVSRIKSLGQSDSDGGIPGLLEMLKASPRFR